MTTPDPADLRLLALLARSGRAAVHELAAEIGMDPREAATRLVTLSANGMPLIVGAECDQNRLGAFLAAQPPGTQPPAPFGNQPPGPQPLPVQQPGQYPYPPSTPLPYQAQPGAAPQYPPGGGVLPHPAPQPGTAPSYPFAPPPGAPSYLAAPPTGTPSHPAAQHGVSPYPAAQPGDTPPHLAAQVGPGGPATVPDAVHTWGPPQSASWARGDTAPEQAADRVPAPRVGQAQTATGADGTRLRITLLEVVDPADSLFAAAGHTLGAHERAVVVHTEVTNVGERAYPAVPDQHLMLYTADGHLIGKAPVALSSRPAHPPGVPPGRTVGGHAVYVIGQRTRISEVRWLAGPDAVDTVLRWGL